MLSRRPYLIRALYEWLLDCGDLPHLLVDATAGDGELPEDYVQDGRIVLNVSPSAVLGLQLGNDEIRFSARFGGTSRLVRFAPAAVLAIYGRDSGQGMMFGPEDDPDPAQPSAKEDDSPARRDGEPPRPGKPSLKIIK